MCEGHVVYAYKQPHTHTTLITVLRCVRTCRTFDGVVNLAGLLVYAYPRNRVNSKFVTKTIYIYASLKIVYSNNIQLMIHSSLLTDWGVCVLSILAMYVF